MNAIKVGFIILLFIALPVRAEDAPTRPPIVALSHIALFVKDIEASRAFYKDFLGFAEPYTLKNDDGTLKLTWIKVNDEQSIELFPEREVGSDRLYHIAVVTDDAEGMRKYLGSKGVT